MPLPSLLGRRALWSHTDRWRGRNQGVKRTAVSPCPLELSLMSFPLYGNVCNKPLDSGFRRNDDGDGNHGTGASTAFASGQRRCPASLHAPFRRGGLTVSGIQPQMLFPLCGHGCAPVSLRCGFRLSSGGYGRPRWLVPDAALPPASLRACIPAGVSINDGGGGIKPLTGSLFRPAPHQAQPHNPRQAASSLPAAGRRGGARTAPHPLALPRPNRYSAPHATSTHLRHPRFRQAPDQSGHARGPGRSPRQGAIRPL